MARGRRPPPAKTDLDFLIVTPEGKSSFYINSADGRVRYSDFLIREFIPYIERITRFAGSAPHEPSAACRWGDMVRFGLPLLIRSYSRRSVHRVPRSSPNHRDQPEELSPTGPPLAKCSGGVRQSR